MSICIKCHKEHPHMIAMCGPCYQKIYTPITRQMEIVMEQNLKFWKLLSGGLTQSEQSKLIDEINILQNEFVKITERENNETINES